MELMPLQASFLSLLNLDALRAFHPSPETGTLFGPCLENDSIACRLIADGQTAGLTRFSELALAEAGTFWRLCASQGLKKPHELYRPRQGTPWYLDQYRPGDGSRGSQGSAVFRSVRPTRRIEANLQSAQVHRYSFVLESPEARFIQSISVGTGDGSVQTEEYSAKVRGISLANGIRLAVGLASAIYRPGQYDAEKELGALRFRQGEFEEWTDLPSKKGRFQPPLFNLDSHAEIHLASSLSVYDGSPDHIRQPVVSLRLSPTSINRWDLDVSLRRPLSSERRLMPLSAKLQKVLWSPILGRILQGAARHTPRSGT